MKHKLFVSALVLSTAVTSFARLGDTWNQSVNRFGKPLGSFKDKYAQAALFEYKNYAVFVRYRNGKSFEEVYAYLAPGVKEKIRKEEYWEDCFSTLNVPENLIALSGKQRSMLRRANLKTIWKFGKFKANGIEEKYASLGKRKATGFYYIKKKFLVITKTTASPAPRARAKEIAQAKAMCMPLNTSFKNCTKKYGIPYQMNAPKWCDFQKNDYSLRVFYNNLRVNSEKINGKLPKHSSAILNYMNGGTSKSIMYMTNRRGVVKKYEKKLKDAREFHRKHCSYKTFDDDLYIKGELKSCEASIIDPIHLDSIPINLRYTFLHGTTKTKWKSIGRSSINEFQYSTWKDGRRLYGIYDIIFKSLKIEYGITPSDYNHEVIKKLKAKKAEDALIGF